VWWENLQYVPASEAISAARAVVVTQRFAPSIAELLHEIAEHNDLIAPSWGEAWLEISEAIKDGAPSRLHTWSHPVLKRTIDAVGWYDLRTSTNVDTLRAQLREIYKDLAATSDRQKVIASAKGLEYGGVVALTIGSQEGKR
jgi:hypothetical protein